MKVPLFDWPRLCSECRGNYLAVIGQVLSKGGYILREHVDRLEASLRRVTGAWHAIALSDATNSMLLGQKALGLPNGYEAILPSNPFVTAAQAIHFSGEVAIPMELGPSHLIGPRAVKRDISPPMRVLTPLHVNGRVRDVDRLQISPRPTARW